MKRLNRILTLALVAAMALSLAAPTSAVSEDVRAKFNYNYEVDPLNIYPREDGSFASKTIAGIAEEIGTDGEQYLYELAHCGIITISIRSANIIDVYAGPYYPNGNGDFKPTPEKKLVSGYTDVAPEAWYYDAVMETTKGGLVIGSDSGAFRPNDKVTSAEFATVLCRIYNLPIEVFGGPWYGPYIDAVIAAGLDFSSCNYKQAEEEITRGEAIEAMAVMVRALGREPQRNLKWANVQDADDCRDVPAKHGWNPQALLDALNYGAINGTNAAHRVGAADSLTRAEFCKMLYNIGVTDARSVDSYKANAVHRQYTGR